MKRFIGNLIREGMPGPLTRRLFRLRRRLTAGPTWYQRASGAQADLFQPTRILCGPFQGMRYEDETIATFPSGKILGTYELELHDAIERLCDLDPDLVVNIGSADGYYAVGLARRLPAARVVAHEILRYRRYLTRRLARLNQVQSRVASAGACSAEGLEAEIAAANRPLIVCDCEGAEDELLRPDVAPALARALILVETHDLFRAGVTERLESRFEPTHEIEVIHAQARTEADLPPGVELPPETAAAAMNERRRGPQVWLVMVPRVP